MDRLFCQLYDSALEGLISKLRLTQRLIMLLSLCKQKEIANVERCHYGLPVSLAADKLIVYRMMSAQPCQIADYF